MKSIIPKVSIIVPVYNAGNRFVACMDTLVNQTLKDIEIILVLDCPTDGSDTVARQYAAKDKRIVILENEVNLHIGNSRNRGLEVAQGEYIGFSDHDDYRELTMYEELYKKAKSENSDIVLGISILVGDQDKREKFPPELDNAGLKEYALNDLIRGGDDFTLTPKATNVHPNIYRKEFLKKHEIQFVDSNLCTPEDRIFQIMSLFHAQAVSLCEKHLYYHVMHSESAGRKMQYQKTKFRANGKLKVYEFLKANNCYEKYEPNFLFSVKREFSNLIVNELVLTKNINLFSENLKYLKSLPFCRKAYKTAHYSLSRYGIGGKLLHKAIGFLMKL